MELSDGGGGGLEPPPTLLKVAVPLCGAPPNLSHVAKTAGLFVDPANTWSAAHPCDHSSDVLLGEEMKRKQDQNLITEWLAKHEVKIMPVGTAYGLSPAVEKPRKRKAASKKLRKRRTSPVD